MGISCICNGSSPIQRARGMLKHGRLMIVNRSPNKSPWPCWSCVYIEEPTGYVCTHWALLVPCMQLLQCSPLEHDTLEVLVLTCDWAGGRSFALKYTPLPFYLAQTCGFVHSTELWGLCHLWLVRRCSRLRTLVLVLEDQKSYRWSSDDKVADLVARLPALVVGAPALRALQLVLPMTWGITNDVAEGGLGPLWRALEALPHLASLALGWVLTHGNNPQYPAPVGERIANVLDSAQVCLSR